MSGIVAVAVLGGGAAAVQLLRTGGNEPGGLSVLRPAGRSPATSAARSTTGPRPSGSSATALPSLVYGTPRGMVILGIAPVVAGSLGTRPSGLYVSTDGMHWRHITPSQSQPTNGSYGFFEQASFLDPTTGWVTSWNPGTTKTTIFRTTNSGRSWTEISGGFRSANAGAASLIDLGTQPRRSRSSSSRRRRQ